MGNCGNCASNAHLVLEDGIPMPISTKLVYGYTSVKVVINSCMTVKEIINELHCNPCGKTSLHRKFFSSLDIPRGTVDSAYIDRIHLLVPLAFPSGCGSWLISRSPIVTILQFHTIPSAPDLATSSCTWHVLRTEPVRPVLDTSWAFGGKRWGPQNHVNIGTLECP